MAAIESNIGKLCVELLGRKEFRANFLVYPAFNIPSFEEDIRKEQKGAEGLTWHP